MSKKSEALECFKIFKLEVEKQLEKHIKIVRSDRGGEYFGRYSELGQHKGPFATFLEEHGIMAQYTTPGTPQQNGVAERKNRTFKDMIRSMFASSKLPIFLWGEALKTANYILNRVPSKSVDMVPFEAWTGRRPSFNHFHIWGCQAEARFYNPAEKKLDPRTTSCRFIGYSEKSKGYKFYCPHGVSRIMETHNARFIEESNEAQPIEDVSACEKFEELVSDNSFNGFLPQQGTIISVGTQLQPVVHTVAFDYCGTNTNTLLENEVTDMEVDQAIPLNDPTLEVGIAIETATQTQPNEEIISRRRSQREIKVVILPDFVYLNEAEYNLGDEDDLITYH